MIAWMRAAKKQISASGFQHCASVGIGGHTCSRSVLPEVLGLVSSHKSLGLDFWSRTSRKLLVEAHNALHTSSICGGTEPLYLISIVLPFIAARLIRVLVWIDVGIDAGIN
jgi:hypothetical protein